MSEDDLIEASPCKLRNGNWGCRTTDPVEVGDTVRIVTRANKQWRARITQIVWTGDQVWLCETESENAGKPGKAQSSSAGSAAGSSSAPASGPSTGPSTAASAPDSAPPRTEEAPSDDLDAMADAAAERDDAFDDLMSAVHEFERDEGGSKNG